VLVSNLRDFLLRILPAINRLLGLVLDGLDHLVMGVPRLLELQLQLLALDILEL
jgi:hypothetical protein